MEYIAAVSLVSLLIKKQNKKQHFVDNYYVLSADSSTRSKEYVAARIEKTERGMRGLEF
jgi:hypothetical protein